MTFWFVLGALLPGVVMAIKFFGSTPSPTLQSKFVGLGTLTGKTRTEIIAAAGRPNGMTAIPGGQTLLQWVVPSYQITLIFDGEICEGIQHEFSSND